MNTLPPPVSASVAVSSSPVPQPAVALAWRDCLQMSPEVAAIVMGVSVAQAESHLRTAATRRSRHDHATDVVGDFKHSALAFLHPGHAPMTQTYKLILNYPIAERYQCRGCKTSLPLPDSGLETLCEECSLALKARREQEKREWAEHKAQRRHSSVTV